MLEVIVSNVKKIIQGEISMEVASRLGVTPNSVTDFINGKVNPSMGMAFGMPSSKLQEIRNCIGREGAIGMVLGMALAKRVPD